MNWTIEAICTGTARPFNGAELSAIAKYPRAGTVQLLKDGFAPDEQADRRVHGGPDKAVHLYPLDHHDHWRDWLDDPAVLDQPGAFGSNLAVRGIDESAVHIGDQFRIGSAVIEVSQPRQPCWKIDHRFGTKGMTAAVIESGRCGWYLRVVETGDCQAGDTLVRIKTGHAEWSVARTFACLVAGKATRAELEELAQLESLALVMRQRAIGKLGQ